MTDYKKRSKELFEQNLQLDFFVFWQRILIAILIFIIACLKFLN